jgi:hypothetical protein
MQDAESYFTRSTVKQAKHIKRIIYKSIFFFFLLTWTLLLWVTAIYKLDNDGITFFTFFTNWNWTLQIVFFTLEVGALFSNIKWVRVFNMSIVFWLTNGTTWLVFWLVFFMFKDNANFLLQISTIDGGPYAFWIVLEGNALFHVLISISMLAYVIIRKDYVDDSVSIFLNWNIEEKSSYVTNNSDSDNDYEESKRASTNLLGQIYSPTSSITGPFGAFCFSSTSYSPRSQSLVSTLPLLISGLPTESSPLMAF